MYGRLSDEKPVNILEIGCGTGAVLRSVCEEFPIRPGIIAGLDIDRNALHFASSYAGFELVEGNGERLPFTDDSFDLVFCHFLLLWTKDPVKIVAEMRRVTAENGICAAFAEPCYSEMYAKPKELYELAARQRMKLADSGANVDAGKCLVGYFSKAGFGNAEYGRYQTGSADMEFLEQEIRQMLRDSGQERFEIKSGVQYEYNVPTYFAYAVKS